jgi:hypothetical protein
MSYILFNKKKKRKERKKKRAKQDAKKKDFTCNQIMDQTNKKNKEHAVEKKTDCFRGKLL